MMNKRYGWLVLLILMVVLFLASWWWWQSPSSFLKRKVSELKPEVEVTAINIYEINDDRIKLKATIDLRNPLAAEINAKQLNYAVFIDSVKVIENIYDKPFRITAQGHTAIEMPMEILVKPMQHILEKLKTNNRDSATYTLRTSFHIDVPIAGDRDFRMKFSKMLPALRIPKGDLEKVTVDKLGLNESSLDLILKIDNPNVFPLKLDNGYYNLTVDKDLDMDGHLEKSINIPPKGSTPVSMHVVLKTAKFGKLAWKSLFDKKDTHFKLVFTGNINSENEVMNGSKLSLAVTGTLDDLKK